MPLQAATLCGQIPLCCTMSTASPKRSPRKSIQRIDVISALRQTSFDSSATDTDDSDEDDGYKAARVDTSRVTNQHQILVPKLPPLNVGLISAGPATSTLQGTSLDNKRNAVDTAKDDKALLLVDRNFLPRGIITDSHCIERLHLFNMTGTTEANVNVVRRTIASHHKSLTQYAQKEVDRMTVEAAQSRGILLDGFPIRNGRDFKDAFACLDGKNVKDYGDFFHCAWEIFANTPNWQETIVMSYFLVHKLKYCPEVKKTSSYRCCFTKLVSHVKCERNRQMNAKSRKVKPGYILKPEADDSMMLAFPTESAETPIPATRKKGSVFHPSYVKVAYCATQRSKSMGGTSSGLQDLKVRYDQLQKVCIKKDETINQMRLKIAMMEGQLHDAGKISSSSEKRARNEMSGRKRSQKKKKNTSVSGPQISTNNPILKDHVASACENIEEAVAEVLPEGIIDDVDAVAVTATVMEDSIVVRT